MKCLRCNKKINDIEAKKIEDAENVDPFCNRCAEIYGGIPLPYSRGDGISFDILNGGYFNERKRHTKRN